LTLRLLGAAVAASVVLTACGGGHSVPPPQGPPTLRHPASQVEAAQIGEEMRAHLVAASALYGVGRQMDAKSHVDVAQSGYARLTQRVRSVDPVLDREINASFGVIAGQIARKEAPPQVTNRMGLVQGQLLDAAIGDAVGSAARSDPTVAAQVLVNLANEGLAEYSRGGRGFQDSFGLITRAVAVARSIQPALGPEAGVVVNSINAAHNDGFPFGVLPPKTPQRAKFTADVRRTLAGVARRFRVG
jgi:hypothetical protein